MTELVIGSRGSALALAQTNWVADNIKLHNPDVEIRVEVIKTKGDKILDTPLAKIGDKGLFVKEIELALADGTIDLAVHSMKDLPSEMTEGLTIGAVPKRVHPCDVLLSKKGLLADLPPGSTIGSSSLRRKAQILHHFPELDFHDLRGNLDTRINRLLEDRFDGIILAFAGLKRLGLLSRDGTMEKHPSVTVERLSFDVCLPAVGQGALAIQIREGDGRTADMIRPLNDFSSYASVIAERALLSNLGGGCQVPIAAIAAKAGRWLRMKAMVASLDGTEIIYAKRTDDSSNAAELGKRIADELIDAGADQLLALDREQSGPTDMGAA
jgi:hydroxymethylbilane synthase